MSISEKKRVLITGGTGSWGQELVSQIVEDDGISEIVIYSRGEHRQVEMKMRFSQYQDKIRFIIGDVRDIERLRVATKGVDKIFHMAALKHVPVCEDNPWEAVQTNIVGTNNVIDAAIFNDVERVVMVSTDKAVDPLNLYGVTKSCAEKLIINANTLTEHTKFVCIRAGNVLGTNGSVIPLFIQQIRASNMITITDPRMTRFFLRVEDAIRLVLRAEQTAIGGELMVVRMPSCGIMDIAKVMISCLGNANTKISIVGIRPGEKLHEVLISRYEASRVIREGDWFVILPMIKIKAIDEHYGLAYDSSLGDEYSSLNSEQLTTDGIKKLLEIGGFLDESYKSNFSEFGPDDLLNWFRREGWVRDPHEIAA